MASVRQIAEHAGVSIATVSRVLNNDPAVNPDTRDKVLSAANRWGYAPAIGRRITTYIGFAYTGRRTLVDAFDTAVLDGVARGADDARLDVVILNLARDKQPDETYTQFFIRKGVRGVVLRTVADTRDVCLKIAEEGFPHVVVSDRFDSSNVNYIDGESKADSIRAVEYLLSLGHRRIGFAMHSVPDCDHLDRFEAYRQALEARGLPFEEQLVFRHPINLAAGGTIIKLSQSMRDRPTAVYFADPLLAVGAVQKAHEMGVRVPEDLSIIGFDDADLRHAVYPTLTAVCQDAGKLGFQAAAWLGHVLRGTGPRRFQKTIPTFFEINRSTAPPTNGELNGVFEHNHMDSAPFDGAGVAPPPVAEGSNGQDMRGRS
jgi:DNA-binding LacI/PurR family transcriptional regulator